MKRYFTFLLVVFTLMGSLWASGSADYGKMSYIPSETVAVEPTSDILSVFADNDDDDLYSEALPFLKGEADRHDMPHDVDEYIKSILTADADDIMDLIRDELKAPLQSGKADGSFMALGNVIVKADIRKTEGAPSVLTYARETLDFEPAGTLSVYPSENILAVFSDNDDDGLYEEALPFLSGESDRNDISRDVADYIWEIITEDTDDIMDIIKEELKSVLIKGSVEKSEMALGTYAFSATLESPAVYKFRSEEIPYEPVNNIKVNPSSDILSVFEDNDDDELYSEALPYLKGEMAANGIPVDVSNYIAAVIADDCDDLRDLIRDELKASMADRGSDGSYMVLGEYVFSAMTSYMN